MASNFNTKLRLAAAVVLATVTIIVLLQNVDPVQTRLLFVTVSMPRAALLAITLLVGFVLGVIFSLYTRRGK